MEEVEAAQGKRASAKFNGEIFLVETQSGYRMVATDPQGTHHLLPASTTDETLGNAVLDALKQSRFLTLEESNVFFEPRKLAERYAKWTNDLMADCGYKNKRALFKNMMSCNIALVGGTITMPPTIHDKLDSWVRRKSDNLEDVVIPATSTPAEVGAALRLAFSRCR